MSALWQDIRYGLRMLARNPRFSAVVILIVGLGVGVNTAIFSALDRISFRPLPVAKARELVGIHFRWRTREGASGTDGIFNYPVYDAFRGQTDIFAGLAAFSYDDLRFRADQAACRVQGLAVSGNYFSVLGVVPSLGRLFSPEQEPDTAAIPVAVISDRFRRQQFGADADVLGEQVVVNDRSLTVIGVTPPGFTGSVVGWIPDVYVPLGTYAAMDNNSIYRDTWTWLHLLGRLQPGVGRDQAEAALGIVSRRLKEFGLENVHDGVLVADGSRGWIARDAMGLSRPLVLSMIAAASILIIAAFNIANMQLSRATARHREIAIRRAVGAGCGRIVRQLLVENLLLTLAGGACGVVMAVSLDRIVCSLVARIGSISMAGGLDSRGMLFALGVSLLAGLVFGLAPGLHIIRRDVMPALKESSGFIGVSVGRWNPHHALVTVQVAMAVAISVCAGLFLRSMASLHSINPGYDTQRLLAVTPQGRTYDRPPLRRSMEQLLERIKDLPGTETACLASSIPLGERGSARGVSCVDGVAIPEGTLPSLAYAVVSPEYFRVLNMPLLAGRLFSARDGLDAPRVMVINDVMARQYWPDESPLGKSVTFRGEEGLIFTVIGVVRAATMRSILEGVRPVAYWPLSQDTHFTPALLIRTTGSPQPFIPTIRKEAAALGFPEGCGVGTVADRVADLLFPVHAITTIVNVFNVAGLLLCVTGLYGVMTDAVGRCRRDIGIRMALGAEARDVVRSILGQGLRLTFVGLGLGLGTSVVALRALQSQLPALKHWDKFFLYGVDVWDPVIFVGMSLLLLSVAVVACYFPARRAVRVDPMVALRCE